MSFDVFKPNKSRSYCFDPSFNERPEMTLVFFSSSLACGGKWLTRVGSDKKIDSIFERFDGEEKKKKN